VVERGAAGVVEVVFGGARCLLAYVGMVCLPSTMLCSWNERMNHFEVAGNIPNSRTICNESIARPLVLIPASFVAVNLLVEGMVDNVEFMRTDAYDRP
jgi:hypothetical protein